MQITWCHGDGLINQWPAGTCLGSPPLPGPPAPGALGSLTPSPPALWGIQKLPEPGIQGSTWPLCTWAFSLCPPLPTPAHQPERVIEIPARAPHFPRPGLSLHDFLYVCFCSHTPRLPPKPCSNVSCHLVLLPAPAEFAPLTFRSPPSPQTPLRLSTRQCHHCVLPCLHPSSLQAMSS